MALAAIYESIRDEVRDNISDAGAGNCFVAEDNVPQEQIRLGYNIIPGTISVPEMWAKHFAVSVGIYSNFPTAGTSDANIIDSTKGLEKLAADLRPVLREFAFGQTDNYIGLYYVGQSDVTQSKIGNGTVFQIEVFFEGRIYESPALI